MGWPHSSSAVPVFSYLMTLDPDTIDPLKWRVLLKGLEPILPPLPAELRTRKAEEHGWYFLDETEATFANQFVVIGRRTFKKKVPPLILKRELTRRLADWVAAHNKTVPEGDHVLAAPGAVRKDMRDALAIELRANLLPTITESPILIDTNNSRVTLFDASESRRDEVLKNLSAMFADLLGYTSVNFTELELEPWLCLTRPGVSLPGEVGGRFLSWLADNAADSPYCTMPIAGGRTINIKIALADHATLNRNGGHLHVKGASSLTVAVINELIRGEEAAELGYGLHNFYLNITDLDAERTWTVKIDKSGQPLRMTTQDPSKDDADGTLQTKILLAAEDVVSGHRLVLALWEAFNRSEVTRWMADTPQTQLWPGAATGTATWTEAQGDADPIDDEDEAERLNLPPRNRADLINRWITNGRGRHRFVESTDDIGLVYNTKGKANNRASWQQWNKWTKSDPTIQPEGFAP